MQYNTKGKNKEKSNNGKHLGWYKNGKIDELFKNGKYKPGYDMTNPEVWEETNYINDINLEYTEVLMTRDSEDNYRAAYTYADGERIGVEDLVKVEGKPNNPLYYLKDSLGSITAITNMNAEVIDTNRFAPYGEALDPVAKNTRLTNSQFGFTGEMHDVEANLVYLRARHYEPSTARFIQQDTYLGETNEPLSRHLYMYAQGNPLTYVDPSGHISVYGEDENGNLIVYNQNTGNVTNRNTGEVLYKVYDQIVDMASNVISWRRANSRTVNNQTYDTVYAQIYLWELEYEEIGTSGPYRNGVDGDYGNGSKKAILEFQEKAQRGEYGSKYQTVQITIKKRFNSDGKAYYEGELNKQTLYSLNLVASTKIERREEEWKNIIKSSGSLLDKEKYPLANPRYYLIFHNSWQSNVDPILLGRMAALAKDRNMLIQIGSGYRTFEEQAKLRKKYEEDPENNPVAARPGESWHNYGEAVDITGWDKKSLELKELGYYVNSISEQTTLQRYGLMKHLYYGNPSGFYENWHIQPIETKGVPKTELKRYSDAYEGDE